MTPLTDTNLCLFMTQGMSLEKWDKGGVLEREVLLYQKLHPYFKNVYMITYGSENDISFMDKIQPVKVLPVLTGDLNLDVANVSHMFSNMNDQWIIKSNQFYGALTAARVAGEINQPFVWRMGYGFKLLNDKRKLEDPDKVIAEERKLSGMASHIIVTAGFIKEQLETDYMIWDEKISIIPNYVSSVFFDRCWTSKNKLEKILVVGRCSVEKNPIELLKAVKQTGKSVTWIGRGALSGKMQQFANDNNVNLELIENVNHYQLPKIFENHDVFVLPSLHEGHPKSLIEAMSFGMPCIGSNVEGIRDVIIDHETGLLCSPDADGFISAFRKLENQSEWLCTLGQNGRRFAFDYYHIDQILEKEKRVYEQLFK